MPNATEPHDCVYSVAHVESGRVLEVASYPQARESEVIGALGQRLQNTGGLIQLWGPGELPPAHAFFRGKPIAEVAAEIAAGQVPSSATRAADALTIARAAVGELLVDPALSIGPAQRESLVDLLDELREHITACEALAQVRDFPRPHSVEPPAPATPLGEIWHTIERAAAAGESDEERGKGALERLANWIVRGTTEEARQPAEFGRSIAGAALAESIGREIERVREILRPGDPSTTPAAAAAFDEVALYARIAIKSGEERPMREVLTELQRIR